MFRVRLKPETFACMPSAERYTFEKSGVCRSKNECSFDVHAANAVGKIFSLPTLNVC
jgi:hypothetical protein